jgi:hypothetical protein
VVGEVVTVGLRVLTDRTLVAHAPVLDVPSDRFPVPDVHPGRQSRSPAPGSTAAPRPSRPARPCPKPGGGADPPARRGRVGPDSWPPAAGERSKQVGHADYYTCSRTH